MSEMSELLSALKEQTAALSGLAMGQKHDTAATSGNYTQLHGRLGIFSGPGLERDVISAHIRPMGIANQLPLLPSTTEDPRFGTLTGYGATSGAEAVNPCDVAPTGYVKGCNLTARFGRVMRDTRTIELDKVIMTRNRGDFTDLVLKGRVLGLSGLNPTMSEQDMLNIVTKSEMVIAAVNMERTLMNHVWNGNPANNTAGGGYAEFPGLSRQIATGQVDADTNTACPALDSDVKSFGYSLVDGTARDIVEYLSMLEYQLTNNAERMGLTPATWAVVMRPQLWMELSGVWPCMYNTSTCITQSGATAAVDATDLTAQRDAMRNNKTIVINGNTYPVITDDGITELTPADNANILPGQYASSIFFLPLTITGGWPVTYREYVDYKQTGTDAALAGGKLMTFWSDGGVYLHVVSQTRFCYVITTKTEQRIILRTPQLAGRIDAVRIQPLQHLRSFNPSDTAYFADGGVSARSAAAVYAVWGNRGAQ